MLYEKFRPCELLAPFVECYYTWQSGTPLTDTLVLESPPSGFCSIVFNTGDTYFLENKKYPRLQVPQQFVAGQSLYSYKLHLSGSISVAGIVLRPTALFSLFRLNGYEYTEERVDLRLVFEDLLITPLVHKLQSATSGNDKARILEEFVLKWYRQEQPVQDSVDAAANLIVDRNGMVHITDLLKEVYMSRRNFERNFFKKVGLSPKYYARIRRMGCLMNLIAGKKKVDWASVFSECQFYDQSHFIKDFVEFTGRSPQQYLEENAELANLIEKPRTNDIEY